MYARRFFYSVVIQTPQFPRGMAKKMVSPPVAWPLETAIHIHLYIYRHVLEEDARGIKIGYQAGHGFCQVCWIRCVYDGPLRLPQRDSTGTARRVQTGTNASAGAGGVRCRSWVAKPPGLNSSFCPQRQRAPDRRCDHIRAA